METQYSKVRRVTSNVTCGARHRSLPSLQLLCFSVTRLGCCTTSFSSVSPVTPSLFRPQLRAGRLFWRVSGETTISIPDSDSFSREMGKTKGPEKKRKFKPKDTIPIIENRTNMISSVMATWCLVPDGPDGLTSYLPVPEFSQPRPSYMQVGSQILGEIGEVGDFSARLHLTHFFYMTSSVPLFFYFVCFIILSFSVVPFLISIILFLIKARNVPSATSVRIAPFFSLDLLAQTPVSRFLSLALTPAPLRVVFGTVLVSGSRRCVLGTNSDRPRVLWSDLCGR